MISQAWLERQIKENEICRKKLHINYSCENMYFRIGLRYKNIGVKVYFIYQSETEENALLKIKEIKNQLENLSGKE